jgi:hypothetical protein
VFGGGKPQCGFPSSSFYAQDIDKAGIIELAAVDMPH